jgi:AraC-like DNA-binding protein/quercetin dioxygenase-like cupin family protein
MSALPVASFSKIIDLRIRSTGRRSNADTKPKHDKNKLFSMKTGLAKNRPAGPAQPGFFSPHVSSARRFYLDLNPAPQVPLAVVSGGLEQCTPDYSSHRSTFAFYSLEFVLRGQGRVKLRGRTYELQPGTLFSYGPGVRHDIESAGRGPLVKYFVDFSGLEAPPLLRACHLAPGNVSRVFLIGEVQTFFDELIRSGVKGSRFAPDLCAGLLKCLALKIAESRSPVGGAGNLSFATFQACQEHIQTHFLELKSLAQIARQCHVHRVYLCRLFQRYNHQSPYQYLMRLKMNHAAERLSEPGAMVKQVAEQVGFADPFHFSRVFKSVLGLSPKAFARLRPANS